MQEGYPSAIKSKTGKQKFLETLEGIKAQLEKSVEHVKNKVEQEKRRRDELDEQYKQLLDKERAYYRAAKEFQEECRKTEVLNTKLSQLQKK
jgi:predicted RNase H-like nuclease (RuvC/YqgF family)